MKALDNRFYVKFMQLEISLLFNENIDYVHIDKFSIDLDNIHNQLSSNCTDFE